MEEIHLDASQQAAYDAATRVLREPATEALGDFFAAVSVANMPPPPSLSRLDKQEATWVVRSDRTTRPLTTLLTGREYVSAEEALQDLQLLEQTVPRRVCQHPFRKNDIVWVCRTCQADETCVLCHNCFSDSDHEGHDVNFYHAQAGGCCDCGDPAAWDPAGFCPRHGPEAHSAPNAALPPHLSHIVKGIVPAVVDWMVQTVAVQAERAHARVQPTLSFSTAAASNGGSTDDSPATTLGKLGSQQSGLHILLHADEVHSPTNALAQLWGSSDRVNDAAQGLRTQGQLVVYGKKEISRAVGETLANLWQDGDAVACNRVGNLVQEQAHILRKQGFAVSILTFSELLVEQTAVAVLQWLSAVARSCDPLCQTVAEGILPNRHLVPLLQADFKMSSRVTKAWYSLLLTLLAVPAFKSHLAAAYCDTYRDVTAKYARGLGVLERSGYTLSVQFLNRYSYVVDLVEREFISKLGQSLLDTFFVATEERKLNPEHFVLVNRRYSPCISDLKCVLNVPGMARVAMSGSFLRDWISVLCITQLMDSQAWRHRSLGHVADESRGWVGAFNASISLGSLFERLLGWKDDDPCPVPNQNLLSCVELAYHVLTEGVARWQETAIRMFPASSSFALPHERAGDTLPFSTIATKHGACEAMNQLAVSQVTPFSFHLPLHRFVASAIRELCLRKHNTESGVNLLMKRLHAEEHSNLFFLLMEFPTLVLSRVFQVRSDLWRRNGSSLNDQVLNYAEPPFCRNMRDADLLLAQFSVLGRVGGLSPNDRSDTDVGFAFLSNLLLHRLGLFEHFGFISSPTVNVVGYREQVKRRRFKEEQLSSDAGEVQLPWTYSPTQDSSSQMKLLEEYLHFMVMFVSELPPFPPTSKSDHTLQAKSRLRREVIHRLSSGKKTHSELSEVHHVLSHWDNVLLSDEGKLVNPDDATGAALAAVLEEVADRKVSTGSKPEPDKWELCLSAWDKFDPGFYHISMRHHQAAAENRPKPKMRERTVIEARPYAPVPALPHPFFARLRRDATADATVLAVVYKVLHVHCRSADNKKSTESLSGRALYENKERSEVALARALHILTLGAYAWEASPRNGADWRALGGGSAGSVFCDYESAPTTKDFISACLLKDPRDLTDCDWYEGEDCALFLLQRLAAGTNATVGFVAQDSCVRSGAAWLCKYAASHSEGAARILSRSVDQAGVDVSQHNVSDTESRKRRAREKAMARMKAQAAKFASTIVDSPQEDEIPTDVKMREFSSGQDSDTGPTRDSSFGSTPSSTSSVLSTSDSVATSVPSGSCTSLASEVGNMELANIPSRLLTRRPYCIICNDEEGPGARFERQQESDDGQRKRSRENENALAFVCYAQPSTVLKGGCASPEDSTLLANHGRFVGTHIVLCGHAVHHECCESYLLSSRDDRGKGNEFRCPLCQGLSNCLVPFIDVGANWIDVPNGDSAKGEREASGDVAVFSNTDTQLGSMEAFLSSTAWWVARQDNMLGWDGRSAFVQKSSPSIADGSESAASTRARRPLTKRDLYAAWNAMMRTPRCVRRRVGPRQGSTPRDLFVGEEASGETLVWRRFMDQVTDVAFKADSKRLDRAHFHSNLGEFRHYHVEKHVYNSNITGSRVEWPQCVFPHALSETRKQELSREKLLAKLLTTIQAFTYSVCCEDLDVKRRLRNLSGSLQSAQLQSVMSHFGVANLACKDQLVVMPTATNGDDGTQPFEGRLGKLRYLGLAITSAVGAVSVDIAQLALSLPVEGACALLSQAETPPRAPIAYPLLLGHVLTHIVAAMCAACGRAWAVGDSIDDLLEVSSVVSSPRTPIALGSPSGVDQIIDDCQHFMKLGLMARCLQVLLGHPNISSVVDGDMQKSKPSPLTKPVSDTETKWLRTCRKLLETAVSGSEPLDFLSIDHESFREACTMASRACASYLSESWTVFQVLVPGATVLAAHDSQTFASCGDEACEVLSDLCRWLSLEPIESMIESPLLCQVVANWYAEAARFDVEESNGSAELNRRLRQHCSFRMSDWPHIREADVISRKLEASDVASPSETHAICNTDCRWPSNIDASLVISFQTKKSVPLFGGNVVTTTGSSTRPRVTVIPTSYTDLYAALGTLMPDCETAVCLVCGAVLDSSKRGECTMHSNYCGGSSGVFFLLQECTGLLIHKSKAAYVHSPYVDSHGETPQYRGRPLNLDFGRYDHLRELWFGHRVRQFVVAERGRVRQPIPTLHY